MSVVHFQVCFFFFKPSFKVHKHYIVILLNCDTATVLDDLLMSFCTYNLENEVYVQYGHVNQSAFFFLTNRTWLTSCDSPLYWVWRSALRSA